MPHPLSRRAALLGAAALLPLSACGPVANPFAAAPPAADPTGRADPQMRAVLESLQQLNPRPIPSLTPVEARRNPSLTDAVRRTVQARGLPAAPRAVAQVRDLTVEGAAGPLQARLYDPRPAGSTAPAPLVVYFHGGGWVISDLDTYDASARGIAAEAGAVVLAVHYRQGPEVKFPGAHDDAVAAYQWAVRSAASLGADPAKVALVGESAGGNLAINVAIAARERNLPRPVHQVLVYPVAGTDTDTPSYRENAQAKPLDRATILWMVGHYTRGPQDLADPRLDLTRAELRDLPPTTIILATIDPLRNDGERLAVRLREAGVPVELRTYEGVAHEFYGAASVITKAREAQVYTGERLRQAFAAVPAPAAERSRGRAARRADRT